jgi:hypothetical protein
MPTASLCSTGVTVLCFVSLGGATVTVTVG